MLDRVLQHPWSTTSKCRPTNVHCCRTAAANDFNRQSSTGFSSNGLQKITSSRSLSDVAILFPFHNSLLNDIDGALQEANYYSDSEISRRSSKTEVKTVEPEIRAEDTEEPKITVTTLDEESSVVMRPKRDAQNRRSFKKSVSFADDSGGALTIVSIIENKSSAPKLQISVKKEILSVSLPMNYRWVMEFSVPARQYASFREKVNTQMVSLENIYIDEEGPPCLCGSIKVKNISFHKRVFLRVTYNNWSSSEDLQASHQPSREHHPRFDAFVFRIPLKRPVFSGERIEFAVCFQTDGREFWDSNNSENYLLSSHAFLQSQLKQLNSPQSPIDSSPPFPGGNECYTDFRIWESNPVETVYY